MLILTRRTGESIIIDSNIRVTVLSIDGERVKIGVEAPREVPVLRQELLDEVRQSNLDAAVKGTDRELAAASARAALSRRRQ